MGAITNGAAFPLGEVNQYGTALSAGMGSVPDRRGMSATPMTGFTGILTLTHFRASKSMPVVNLGMYTGTTAAAATPTLIRFGLFSVATNGDLALMSGSSNDTTVFSVVNTLYTRALGATQQVVRGQWYATGLLIVSAAAMPSVLGVATATVASGAVMAEAPRLTSQLTGQSDLPGSIAAGTLTNAVFALWSELT